MTDRRIDLNADLGEGMGDDAAMLRIVTSANIACGGHAGDAATMFRTLSAAAALGVVAGAHPGYDDRKGFGRRELDLPPDEAAHQVVAQVGAIQAVAALVPTTVRYVKLHGALANRAAHDEALGRSVVAALARSTPGLPILAISGTVLERVARAAGTPVWSEIFADRAYLPSGELVPRSEPGAVLHDGRAVAERAVAAVCTGRMPTADGGSIALAADSICVHGDTDGALAMAAELRRSLRAEGFSIRSFVED